MTTVNNPTPILKKSSKLPYKSKHKSRNTSHDTVVETSAADLESASLSHLKEENSHLLNQSYRLISDLESTSHQLLEANSQIHDLQGKLDCEGTGSAKDRVAVMDTQLKFVEEELPENRQNSPQGLTSQHEKEGEWTSNHEALKGHIDTLQHDLRKLRDSTNYQLTTSPQVSTSSVTSYTSPVTTPHPTTKPTLTNTDSSTRLLSQPSYTVSSYSSTDIPSTTTTSTPSLRSHSYSSRYLPKPFVVGGSVTFDPHIVQKADDILSRQSVLATPLANSTLLSSSHLTESSSSINSIHSSQSAREFSSRPPNSRYISYRPKPHYTPHTTSSWGSQVKPRYNSSTESSLETFSDTKPYNPLPSQQGVNSYFSSSRHKSNHKGVTSHLPSQHTGLSTGKKVNRSSSSASAGYSSWQSATNSQPPATRKVKEIVMASRYDPSLSTYGRSGNSYRSSVVPDHLTPPTVSSTNGDGVNPSADSEGSSSHFRSTPRTYLSVLSEKSAPVPGLSLAVQSPVSVTDGELSARVELERAHSKIKQLEKEVDLLEKQLTDKTQSAKHHVEELTEMRVGLTQERSSLAIMKQEIKNSATEEMNRTQAIHSHQCAELQNQLEALKKEKKMLERQVATLNTSLKGSQSECSGLSQRVASIQRQQQQERTSYSETMQLLQKEVKGGCEQVTQLEHDLEMCGNELTGHVTQVEKSTQQYRSDIELLRNQVESLSADLSQSDEKLLRKTELATNMQRELTETRSEFQKETSSWRQRESEMRKSLDQSELLRQSLSKQIERLNLEVKDYSSRLSQQGEMSNEILYARSEIDHLRKVVEELEGTLEQAKRDCLDTNEKNQRLTFELTQEKHKEDELVRKLEHSNVLFQEEVRTREEAESNIAQLKDDLERLGKECDGCKTRVKEAESRAKQREEEMESELRHMQQELAKRARQVLEMDELLRTHQANTAARRLQLERLLTQRQADIRSRTQELEDVMIKYNETKQREVALKQEVDCLRSSEQSLTSQRRQELSSKESKLSSLERQLKEVESVGVVKTKEAKALGEELSLMKSREKVSHEKRVEIEALVAQLTKENDLLRKQHSSQVKRLQETHSTLLSSHGQQSTSHRLQLQELFDQEKTRQEELSRCRAQVASLSAELAAERQVSDAARQQVAVKKAECAKLQAMVSSPQRTQSSSPLSTTDSALEAASTDYFLTQPGRFPLHRLQTSNSISHNSTLSLPSHLYSALGKSTSLPAVQGKLNVVSELGQGVTRNVSGVDVGTDQSMNFVPIFPKTKFKGDIVNM